MINIVEDVQKGPRPMPVILLLDASWSMDGEKINALNRAVVDMIESLKKDKELTYIIAVITFGEERDRAREYLPYTKVQDIRWLPLGAHENTPLGAALKIAKAMIEDKNITPSRSLRPALVLVSDGQPNDDWEGPLDAFINEGRSRKCDRWAMAIGSDADEGKLRRFSKPGQTPDRFFKGDAGEIHKFFEKVSMSVQMYAKSSIKGGPILGGPLGGGSIKQQSGDDDIV